MLGQGNDRGALEKLNLCGSITHPGGGVTGLPDKDAAREMLHDMRCPCGGARLRRRTPLSTS